MIYDKWDTKYYEITMIIFDIIAKFEMIWHVWIIKPYAMVHFANSFEICC